MTKVVVFDRINGMLKEVSIPEIGNNYVIVDDIQERNGMDPFVGLNVYVKNAFEDLQVEKDAHYVYTENGWEYTDEKLDWLLAKKQDHDLEYWMSF